MAVAKNRRSSKSTAPKPIVTDPNNAQTWLYLNPAGPNPSGLVFGVLRAKYADRVNSAEAFGSKKCLPVAPDSTEAKSDWPVTAERVEVILPPLADDRLSDPATLLREMDACGMAQQKALLTYLTLPLGDVGRLHQGWERCRSFARQHLALERQLATILVLHSPGRVSSSNPLHCHFLIIPRQLTGLPLAHGAFDEDLVHDKGQALVENLWTQHGGTFR